MLSLLEKFRNERNWKNRCLLLELIHLTQLRENQKWTIRRTAKMTRISVGTASENLQLAKAIREHPFIAASKSRNKALKFMKGLK